MNAIRLTAVALSLLLLASCASTPRGGDLDVAENAIDISIYLYVSSCRGQNVELDPAEQPKLALFRSKDITNRMRYDGLSEVPSEDGYLFRLDDQSLFHVRLNGGLRAEVALSRGTFGFANGKVFVAEGSTASVNGMDLVFADGTWSEKTS